MSKNKEIKKYGGWSPLSVLSWQLWDGPEDTQNSRFPGEADLSRETNLKTRSLRMQSYLNILWHPPFRSAPFVYLVSKTGTDEARKLDSRPGLAFMNLWPIFVLCMLPAKWKSNVRLRPRRPETVSELTVSSWIFHSAIEVHASNC